MQKRLKESIWPKPQAELAIPDPLSPIDKINKLRKELPQAGYIRQALLIPCILPISSATLWRWVAAGKFPKPVRLSARVTAWRIDEIRAWLVSQELGQQVLTTGSLSSLARTYCSENDG